MNKILLVLSVVIIAVVGWFLFTGDTMNYVAEIDDEVAALEVEFAEIEAALEAGTLTPQEAAEAQTRIAARLDAIASSVANSGDRLLSENERRQLGAALERLKQALTRYSDTLVSVDEAVAELPEAQRPQLNRGGGSGNIRRGITAVFTDTLDTLEEHVEEVAEEYVPEVMDEMATSSNEMGDNNATSSNEMDNDESEADGPTDDGEMGDSAEDVPEDSDASETGMDDTETEAEGDSETDSNFTNTEAGAEMEETETTN